MSSASCDRCGAAAPEALLRNVSLSVDGSEVDSQTICPDCFADWITHYQEQMAGNMAGAERTSDAGTLGETVQAASERADAAESTTEQRLQETVENGANAIPPGQGSVDGIGNTGGASGQTTTNSGDEIREVGDGGTSQSDGVEVDLNGETAVAEEEEDEDDDGGLLLG